MSEFEIRLEGLAEAQRRFAAIDVERAMGRVAPRVMEEIQTTAGRYPPSLDNVRWWRGQPRWYERGAGQMPSGPFNSERMGDQWQNEVRGLEAEVRNEASYSGYVHGDPQPWYHEIRGWRKLIRVAEEKVGDIERALMDELERQFGR